MGIIVGKVPAAPQPEVKKAGKTEYVVAATETYEEENVSVPEETAASEEPAESTVQKKPAVVKRTRKGK